MAFGLICYHLCLQLTVVIERIMAFSLASPLAKFLNGLEILLSKAQVSPDTGKPRRAPRFHRYRLGLNHFRERSDCNFSGRYCNFSWSHDFLRIKLQCNISITENDFIPSKY